jgi:acyl-CoA synthetase (AMP-forming)/AMP-acid ligase II
MADEVRTIPEALEAAAFRFGDAEALAVPGGARLSWNALHTRVTAVARALIAGGTEPGDAVAVWLPNDEFWVLAALGALSAGATLVPVSTRFTGHEALDVITRSRARWLFVAEDFLGTDRLAALRQAAAADGIPLRVRVVPVPGGWPSFSSAMGGAVMAGADVAAARAAAVRPSDISDIMFTSGTTGRSKGAMTSHERSLGVARAWASIGGLTADDRYLIVNPFFHTFGYKAGILACLLTGATIVPQAIYDPASAMRLIEVERITVLPGAPTIYQTILDHPERDRYSLGSLRLAVTGAATIPVALIERMRSELAFQTVLTAYGLTEAVVATMCRPGDKPGTIAATSGRAAADFEVRIGSGSGGSDSDSGGSGEILLRGPNMMLGYLDDPAATAAAIDEGGWLHTGDVGRLDEGGNLIITDRLKDMYICGGFNVYPAEVEQVLARIDGIAESAVIGVPDARLGEVGRAFVVARPGCALEAGSILAYCKERLANYKVPRQVVTVDALPRNASGKVLKRELRKGTGDTPVPIVSTRLRP